MMREMTVYDLIVALGVAAAVALGGIWLYQTYERDKRDDERKKKDGK